MPGKRDCLSLLLLIVAGPLCAAEPVASAPPTAADAPVATSPSGAADSRKPVSEAAPKVPAAAADSDKSAGEATPKVPAAPAAASRSQPASASPQRFNPSERVRADYPVAFPVDI